MSRVLLVHWEEAGAEERAERLRELGHFVSVHWRQDAGGELTRGITADPPDAVVVDLGRLPSHGRAIATWLRQRKALRAVPILFVPGDAAKTARLREAFPDAVFARWDEMPRALPKALAAPPRDPVVPVAPDDSGTPLPKKLGITAGCRLLLSRAPADFAATLGVLPDGVRAVRRLGGTVDVALLFCGDAARLGACLAPAARGLAERGSLWVAWPKKASGVPTDLTENVVRAAGLALSLVDTKVCAIDATWSGLRFSRRRAPAR